MSTMILDDLKTAEEWARLLKEKAGTNVSARTLKKNARKLGKYYPAGKGILLSESQVISIMKTEAVASRSKNR